MLIRAAFDFSKRTGIALIRACALIRSNNVILIMSVTHQIVSVNRLIKIFSFPVILKLYYFVFVVSNLKIGLM